MNSSDSQLTTGLPILLLALAGSLAGLGWWSLECGFANPLATSATLDRAQIEGGSALADAVAPAEFTQQREPLERLRVAPAVLGEPQPERAPKRGSERELRAKYLALEAAEPGYLAAHSQEWLSAERPGSEKVAWLQALCASDPATGLIQLESACKLRDPASPHGESPAAFALEALIQVSPRDAAARAALGRVQSDTTSVDVALRRRAASSVAAFGDVLELDTLAQALLRENDEALRAGVVVALEARSDPQSQHAVARLLAWLRPGSATFLARGQDETP